MPEPRLDTAFIAELKKLAQPAEAPKIARFFFDYAQGGTKIMGVSVGKVFPVAKKFATMPLKQIERLLDNDHYEVRMGAVSIMDFQARARKITPEQRQDLFDLYLRRHDRIDNWDLVDRAAPHVVGGYLAGRPRDVLYRLAQSLNPWERRTAIVATWFFIRAGEIDDTFAIAEMLVCDKHALVQKAVGSWIREAGKRDQKRLLRFLESHAAKMSTAMLGYAMEKLPPAARAKVQAAAHRSP